MPELTLAFGGLGVWGVWGFRVQGFRVRVSDLGVWGFRVSDLGFRVQGFGFRLGVGFRVWL